MKLRKTRPPPVPNLDPKTIARNLEGGLDAVTQVLYAHEIERLCAGANLLQLRVLANLAGGLSTFYSMIWKARTGRSRRPRIKGSI